jgi:capsular polysaccharide biosynthesis protein
MDAVTLVKILFRRWYAVLPLVLIAALLAGVTYKSGKPTYSATYSVIVLPPATQTIRPQTQILTPKTISVNPYANAGGSQLLVRVLASRLIRREGLPSEVARLVGVGAVPGENVPVVNVVVTGASYDTVKAAITGLQASAPKLLTDIQTSVGAPDDQLYVAHDFAAPSGPFVQWPQKSKAVIAILGAGGLLATLVAVGVDALAAELRRRRAIKARLGKPTAPAGSERTPRRADAPVEQPLVETRPVFATAKPARRDAGE